MRKVMRNCFLTYKYANYAKLLTEGTYTLLFDFWMSILQFAQFYSSAQRVFRGAHRMHMRDMWEKSEWEEDIRGVGHTGGNKSRV